MLKLQELFPSFEAPTRSLENWKYTSVNQLLATQFDVTQMRQSPTDTMRVNLTRDHYLNHPFAALIAATIQKTNVITVLEKNKDPIIFHYLQKKNEANFYRQQIHIPENTHADIIFDHQSEDDTACFSNFLTEIVLEKYASLAIYKKQTLNQKSFLIDFISVTQKEKSTFSAITFDHGAVLSRTDILVDLQAPYGKTSLQGIFETTNQQIADHHSLIHHNAPFCESMQHYRGIANGSSTGIFNGKVVIEKDAQKSIVNQLNKNLLLSNKATINTKPELEIYADDVKASHGATVGQLDEQALFYLQSRGIDPHDAKKLLIDGFLHAIFSTIKNKKIAEYLRIP